MDRKNMKSQIEVEGITFSLDHELEGGFEGRPAGVYTGTIEIEEGEHNKQLIKDYFGEKDKQGNYKNMEEPFGDFSSGSIVKEDVLGDGTKVYMIDLWYVVDNLYDFRRDVKNFISFFVEGGSPCKYGYKSYKK